MPTIDRDEDKNGRNHTPDPDKEPEKKERDESKKVQRENKDNDWKVISDVKEMFQQRHEQWLKAKSWHEDKRELTSDEKKLAERAITIEKNRVQETRQEISKLVKELDALPKDDPKREKLEQRQVKLTERVDQAKYWADRFKNELDPKREPAQKRIISNENPREMKERCEKEAFEINSKLGIISELKESRMKQCSYSEAAKVQTVLDVCRYSGETKIHLSPYTMEKVKALHVEKSDLRQVPKSELDKIATMRYPDGVRTFYERGLRVGKENPKPEQINNACKALAMIQRDYPDRSDPKNEGGKKEVINWICQGRIQNKKMSEQDLRSWVDKLEREGAERLQIRNAPQKITEREDKKEDLRGTLLNDPKNFSSSATQLILNSDEKLDMKMLRGIRDEAKDGLEKGEKLEKRELNADEIRQIAFSKNADLLPQLGQLGITLPKDVTIDKNAYDKSLNDIKELKEKNDVMKVAILTANEAIRFETKAKDGTTVATPFQLLNNREDEKLQKILPSVKAVIAEKSKDDRTEKIKEARENLKQVAKEQRERENLTAKLERGWVVPKEMPIADIPRDVSRGVAVMVQREHYNPIETREKLGQVKEIIDNQRKEVGLTMHDAKMRERALDDRTVALVAQKDPRLLVDIQKMEINISKNGAFHEGRLNETISRMERIPNNEVNLRMALLEKHYVTDKNGHMGLSNPYNMGNRDDTRDVKNLALYLYAKENNLKFDEPRDEKEKSRLQSNIMMLEKYEREAKAERTITYELSKDYDERKFVKADNIVEEREQSLPNSTYLQSDYHNLMAAAVSDRNYEEKLQERAENISKIADDRNDAELKQYAQLLSNISQMTRPDMYETRDEDGFLTRIESKDGPFSAEDRILVINACLRNEVPLGQTNLEIDIFTRDMDSKFANRISCKTADMLDNMKDILDRNGESIKIDSTSPELIRCLLSGERDLSNCASYGRDDSVSKHFDLGKIAEIDARDSYYDVAASMKADALNSCGLLDKELGAVIDRDTVYINLTRSNIEKINTAYDELSFKVEKAFPYTQYDNEPVPYEDIRAHFDKEKEVERLAQERYDKKEAAEVEDLKNGGDGSRIKTDDRNSIISGDLKDGLKETTLTSEYLQRNITSNGAGMPLPNDRFVDFMNSDLRERFDDVGIKYQITYPAQSGYYDPTHSPVPQVMFNYDSISASLLEDRDVDKIKDIFGSGHELVMARMENSHNDVFKDINDNVTLAIDSFYEKYVERTFDETNTELRTEAVDDVVKIFENLHEYSFSMGKYIPSYFGDDREERSEENVQSIQEILENSRYNLFEMLHSSFSDDMHQEIMDKYGDKNGVEYGNLYLTVLQSQRDELDRILNGEPTNGDDGMFM